MKHIYSCERCGAMVSSTRKAGYDRKVYCYKCRCIIDTEKNREIRRKHDAKVVEDTCDLIWMKAIKKFDEGLDLGELAELLAEVKGENG